MAEYQRKLLEQIMGKDALISPAIRRREPPMSDHRVCKSFLVGTCPHDLFVGTKQDIGKCQFLHIEKHKLEYEYLAKKKGQKFPDFEYDYYMNLKRYIKDIDRNIESALKRLVHTPEEKAKIDGITKELDSIDIKIGLMTQEIECLIKSNQTLKSIDEGIKLDKLSKERKELAEQARLVVENIGQSAQQKLQVCEQCGAYLSRLDSDRRLADHFIGKIHLGYVQMRAAYDELDETYKDS